MLVSGIQRITLLSCLVLSMALFLPKLFFSAGEKKVVLQSEAVGPGSFPALRYSHGASSGEDQGPPKSLHTHQNSQTSPQRKPSQKSTLLAQVTPVYGFGIFLYIIYLFYKLTHKDQPPKQLHRFSMKAEHTAQDLSEDEMDQLQTRLKQMEEQKERRTSKFLQNPARMLYCGHEERNLHHLRKITEMLVEGRPLEDVTPEVEAEETPYCADWEGYPEETFPQYELPLCRRRHPSIIMEEPYGDVPTPEELAERMEREDEEEDEKNEEETEEVKEESSEDEDGPKGLKNHGELKQAQVCEKEEEADDNEDEEEDDTQDEEEEEEVCLDHNSSDEEETPNSAGNQKEGEPSRRRRQITFSNHRHIFHFPKGGAVVCSYEDEEVEEDVPKEEDDDDDDDDLQEMEMEMNREEDDPLIEAERLGFSTQFCDPEEQEVDLLTYKPEAVINSNQSGAAEAPGLRMRYKDQKKQN